MLAVCASLINTNFKELLRLITNRRITRLIHHWLFLQLSQNYLLFILLVCEILAFSCPFSMHIQDVLIWYEKNNYAEKNINQTHWFMKTLLVIIILLLPPLHITLYVSIVLNCSRGIKYGGCFILEENWNNSFLWFIYLSEFIPLLCKSMWESLSEDDLRSLFLLLFLDSTFYFTVQPLLHKRMISFLQSLPHTGGWFPCMVIICSSWFSEWP